MRQIKFRVYVRFLREMHEVREMIFDKDTVMIDAYQYGLDKDDAPVMQLTGLTDKNGVEIYEGDIVKMSDDNKIAEVRFIQGAFRFISNHILWKHHQDSCEVIGNIHQNPELLDGEQ